MNFSKPLRLFPKVFGKLSISIFPLFIIAIISMSCDKRVQAKTFYVSESGSNKNSGLSIDQALRTLSKAVKLAEIEFSDGPGDIIVRILYGQYYGDKAIIKNTREDSRLVITGHDAHAPPVFDGEGKRLFMRIANPSSTSRNSNVHISNIVIQNYAAAIFIGGRGAHGHVNRNRIENITFNNIGEEYSVHRSVAVIGLVRSSYNTIAGNSFIRSISPPLTKEGKRVRRRTGDIHLHPIYISHKSSNNEIRLNYFSKFSGDPIRVRDYCNYNKVTLNYFENPIGREELAAMSEWYCHANSKQCRRNKNKDDNFSYGNVFRDNILEKGVKGYVIQNNVGGNALRKQASCTLKSSCKPTLEDGTRFVSSKNSVLNSYSTCFIELKSGACPKYRFLTKNRKMPDFFSAKSHGSRQACNDRINYYTEQCLDDKGISGLGDPEGDARIESTFDPGW